MNLVWLRKIVKFQKKNKELGGMPESKTQDSGGPLRAQDSKGPRTIEDSGHLRTQDPRTS